MEGNKKKQITSSFSMHQKPMHRKHLSKFKTQDHPKFCRPVLLEMQDAVYNYVPKQINFRNRWNSIYRMFNRLLEQKQVIIAALSYFILFDFLVIFEWEMFAECLPILKPFFFINY